MLFFKSCRFKKFGNNFTKFINILYEDLSDWVYICFKINCGYKTNTSSFSCKKVSFCLCIKEEAYKADALNAWVSHDSEQGCFSVTQLSRPCLCNSLIWHWNSNTKSKKSVIQKNWENKTYTLYKFILIPMQFCLLTHYCQWWKVSCKHRNSRDLKLLFSKIVNNGQNIGSKTPYSFYVALRNRGIAYTQCLLPHNVRRMIKKARKGTTWTTLRGKL